MSVEWFQQPDPPDTYGEAYSTAAAMANASARPGSGQSRPAGLSTYGVPGLAQAPGAIAALPGPGANSDWVAAQQLPGYGLGAAGAVIAPHSTGVAPSPPGSSQGTSQSSPTAGVDAAFTWVLAWVVIGALALLLIRTQLGYRLVYYGLALTLLFLLLTNYQWLASATAPFQAQQAQQSGG